jgi:hypothetical protein
VYQIEVTLKVFRIRIDPHDFHASSFATPKTIFLTDIKKKKNELLIHKNNTIFIA